MPKPVNLSASRGAAILGLSKWNTPDNVWLHIMEEQYPGFCSDSKYIYPEVEESAALRWGNAFESSIIKLAENATNEIITDREKFFSYLGAPTGISSKYNMEYITCHLDGRYITAAGQPRKNHEGKTTNIFYYKDNFGEPGTDAVPIEYQIQTQHQKICSGSDETVLSVLVFPKRQDAFEDMGYIITSPPFELVNKTLKIVDTINSWSYILNSMGYFHQYNIKKNPELQKLMIEYYTEFWNKNVLEKIPPKPQNYSDIKNLVTEPVGTIIADTEIDNLWQEYRMIRDEIGKTGPLAKRQEIIKVRLLNYLRNKKAVRDDESREKWIVRDQQGKKLFSYNGKVMR